MSETNLQESVPKRRILIADDEVHLADAIAATLDREGLETTVTHDGDRALAMAYVLQPDLILLDVMMPGRSGFELCETLKNDPITASIPIVLITARSAQRDLEAGFAAGADEYLTKPFSPTDLIALVNRFLSGQPSAPQQDEAAHTAEPTERPDLATLHTDQLVVYARELSQLAKREKRQREALQKAHQRLGELDRLKASFLGAVTHEILTPFATIGLPLAVLQQSAEGLSLRQRTALDELATEFAGFQQLITGLVKFSELINKRRELHLGCFALDQVIPAAVQPVAMLAQARQVDFCSLVPQDLPNVRADADLLGEALFQMAHNAVKFNVPEGRAKVEAYHTGEWLVIEVSDTGVGMTRERLALLGQPFEQSADALRRGREGLGIGWAFVGYVAEVHGGRTHVTSPGPGAGSTFSLALPLA